MNTLSSASEVKISSLLRRWEALSRAAGAIARGDGGVSRVKGLQGSARAFFISELCGERARMAAGNYGGGRSFDSGALETFVITAGESDAAEMVSDLRSVFPKAQVSLFQSWGAAPYRSASVGASVFGERAAVLAGLARELFGEASIQRKPRVIVAPLRAFLSPLPPPSVLARNSLCLSRGMEMDTSDMAERLSSKGYTRVPRVYVPGEFSARGEVLDIFPAGADEPARVSLDFDKIENIKTFDPDTQATRSAINGLFIPPAREVIWDEALVKKLLASVDEYEKTAVGENDAIDMEENAHLPFTKTAREKIGAMADELLARGMSEGEEFLHPLLSEKIFSLADYARPSATAVFVDWERAANSEETIVREFSGMYRKARLDTPCLPPSASLVPLAAAKEKFRRATLLLSLEDGKEGGGTFSLHCDGSRGFFGNVNFLREELCKFIADGWSVFVFACGANQAVRLREMLKDRAEGSGGSEEGLSKVIVVPDSISEGFSVPDIKLLAIQENEIFGRKKRRIPQAARKAKSEAIDTFIELNPGDFVVHVQYGIGVFRGIERVNAAGNERDYIKLEYADKEFAFVPVEQVNMVQRYIGNDGDHPKVDRIGSKSWENRKNRVQKAVEDLARKLIDLYSRRKASRGFPFPKDTEWQAAFEAAFPYEDTRDQSIVTEEIKRDMEKPVPMDRLICGDVGFGKTEVAMRAAFKAVMGGRQVAFLAPTTLLAEQHYETCIERFRNFPVKIAELSRFVGAREQKKILSRVSSGDVDILVGTHRIIQKDVAFKNLGLLIIDEEQRFGVRDKDRLKELRANIDCLAMSATPIPRTLHMSLLKIRDMSLLTTPPQNRQPIETAIEPYSDERVIRAARAEVARGGQVFYLHNRVESLLETKRRLEAILPEMTIGMAHGQMAGDELDDIFRRFKMGGFHILVATTIIENGIDIPNVNTIIIDRADMYGVSQLYQLRGRVGRSDRKAFAYMLYPEKLSLSETAMKRLQVISDFTELGSGFKIAMKDMEIRGAGNLLGKDQSGDVCSVGFDLYMRLLNEAVERLSSQKEYKSPSETLLEMEYTGFIPDSYIENTQTKMEVYKKIAAIQTDEELYAMMNEMQDRFGAIPDEAMSLLSLAEIRVLCRRLNVLSLKEKDGAIRVEFARAGDINITKLLSLVKENPGTVSLSPSEPNTLILKAGKIGLKEKSEFISDKLMRIA